MRNHTKLAIILGSLGAMLSATAVRADVPTISGDFYNAHPAESSGYGVLGIVAIVFVLAAIALVMLGAVRRDILSKKKSIKKNDQK